MQDSDQQVTCGSCQRSFSQRRLQTKTVTVESCPYCAGLVRQTEGFAFTNVEAVVMEDVSAVDAWLGNYTQRTGRQATKHQKEPSNEYRWTVETDLPWACEISYRPNRIGFLAFRLVSSDNHDGIMAKPREV